MSIKKFFACFGLILTILLAGQISAPAQNALYAAPARLWLKGDEIEEPETFDPNFRLRERFYPIGWSKDGKFAFFVEPPDEACGCYFAHLVIQDLRTDKILWEKKYTGSEEKEESLRTYWKQNQKEFSRQLRAHGIVPQRRFALQTAGIKYQTDLLTPELTDTTEMNDELLTSGDVVLKLASKEKGRKTIYEKKYVPKEYEGFLGAEIAGSLLSPFEPRAVVVMVETYRGWEGPPNPTGIRIVGTTLTTGFK